MTFRVRRQSTDNKKVFIISMIDKRLENKLYILLKSTNQKE